MSDCIKLECGDCLPDYRYFLNRQAAVFNSQMTVVPDCPQGFVCSENEIIIEEGDVTIIPDVPPYDPDIDPDCDYQCEVDTPRIGFTPVTQLIGNDELVITCEDIGSPDGTEEVTVTADTYTAYLDPGQSFASLKASLNILATNLGKTVLQTRVDMAIVLCAPITPIDADITQTTTAPWVYAPLSAAFATLPDDPKLIGPAINVPPGKYWVRYSSGAMTGTFTDGGFCGLLDTYKVPTQCGLVLAVDGGYDVAHYSQVLQFGPYCGTDFAAVQALASTDLGILITYQRGVMHSYNFRILGFDYDDIGGNCMIQLQRYEEYVFDYPVNGLVIDDYATVKQSFVPGAAATSTGLDTWDGTMTGDTGAAFGSPVVHAEPGQSMNGYALGGAGQTFAAWSGVADGIGYFWRIVISDDADIIWVGAKHEGKDIAGDYIFNPDDAIYTLANHGADVTLVSDEPLQSNTRNVNVLTAVENGRMAKVDNRYPEVGDRILVTAEAAGENNGVYIVTDVGSDTTQWSMERDADMDEDSELIQGMWFSITDGLNYKDSHWRLYSYPGPFTLNTDSLDFRIMLTKLTLNAI